MKGSIPRSACFAAILASLFVATATVTAAPDTDAGGGAASQSGRYGPEAREVMDYVQKTFWDANAGWYTRAAGDKTPDYVWRQAAAFSAVVSAARHEPKTYLPVLHKFFHSLDKYWDSKVPIPAYEPAPTRGNGNDKYYDDNAWVVITFVEAYQLTSEHPFLAKAEATERFVASGWDDQLGGGVWWHQLHKDNSKNTCANGPAAVGDFYLAKFEPPDKAAALVAAAKKTTDWTIAHLQADDGLFDDRVIVATGEVKRGKLTYNSALMLRACLDLYRQTGDAKYLDQAKRIGKAADWFLDKKTGLYRDPLKWSQFMAEADIDLHRTTKEDYLIRRAKNNADGWYEGWKKEKPTDLMSNVGIARVLWLLADTETEAGREFWEKADRPAKVTEAGKGSGRE